jgi:putative CocE/NonD family hydrolase
MQPPALRSIVTGVSKFHDNIEAEERRGGAHEGDRLGWLQFQIGADRLARRHRGDQEGLARAMAEYGGTTAKLASGELYGVLPLRTIAELPGSMIGSALAAMGRPLDAPLSRRPWPSDLYERVQADSFHIGGWYDIFLAGTLSQYQAMRDVSERAGRRVPHMLVGPWTHSSYLGNAGQLDFGPFASGAVLDGRGGLNGEHLRWYDATVKGDEQALAGTMPVRLFVMGENRWRGFDRYPVSGTHVEDWHLQPGGGLDRAAPPDSEPDGYAYDPADPVPTLGGSTMLGPALPPGPFDQREIEARTDVLSYTSGLLEQPCTVLGAVSMTLFVASSATDTDFVARLVDVHPDGRAFTVADGILRASTRDSYPEPGVLRPVPPAPLIPGTPYRLCLDLWATGTTSWAQPVVAFDLAESVGQDARCARC